MCNQTLTAPSSNIFDPVTDVAYPDRIMGQFFGINIPSDVPFYDVRASDHFQQPKATYGETLYSSERISYKLGLLTGWHPQRNDTSMVSVQFSFDARNPLYADEVVERIHWMIREFQKRREVYELAGKYCNPNNGGSVYHKPIFCYLANFGGGVVGTRENYRVIPFKFADKFDDERRRICNH